MVKSFYEIDDLQGSLTQIATTTLREIIAQNTVEQTNVSRAEMDTAILNQLNQTTENWGVEMIRLDIQSITPPESVRKSMEEERAAEIKKRALAFEAEGERDAAIKRADGTKTSMQIISEALRSHPESREILRYLVAQDYVVASQRLGESNNAKIVFLDPSKTNEVYNQLIADSITQDGNGRNSENGNV
jgi:regulator of protease activity HflC (stomatin/prohibitin superfamily)